MGCASWTLGVGPGQIQIPQTAPELCTSPIQNYVKYNLAQFGEHYSFFAGVGVGYPLTFTLFLMYFLAVFS